MGWYFSRWACTAKRWRWCVPDSVDAATSVMVCQTSQRGGESVRAAPGQASNHVVAMLSARDKVIDSLRLQVDALKLEVTEAHQTVPSRCHLNLCCQSACICVCPCCCCLSLLVPVSPAFPCCLCPCCCCLCLMLTRNLWQVKEVMQHKMSSSRGSDAPLPPQPPQPAQPQMSHLNAMRLQMEQLHAMQQELTARSAHSQAAIDSLCSSQPALAALAERATEASTQLSSQLTTVHRVVASREMLGTESVDGEQLRKLAAERDSLVQQNLKLRLSIMPNMPEQSWDEVNVLKPSC